MTTPTTCAHPLDPPTADELTAATALLAREKGVGDGWRLTAMELVEPAKADVDTAEQGGPVPPRRLRVVAYDRAAVLAHVAVVRLDGGDGTGGEPVLESWEAVPGVQPNVTVDEWTEADAVLRAHPDVVAALAARGVTDLDLVFMDTWCFSGPLVPERWAGRRVGSSDTWVRKAPGANPYAGPVGGFHCLIDLGTMELLEIEDDPAAASVPRPSVMGEYVPSLLPAELREASTRPPIAPLDVTQPEGPGFTVEGNLLTWQNWSVRIGFTGREGLVLHRLTYRDGDRVRSVAGRMSFAEMVVPYRDPSVDHARRTAFDIGEWGLGFMTTSLELGCDCLGEIRYLDATLHDSHGAPYTIRNAICLHEEDDAVLWKHVDHGGAAEVRRSRRFVISFHVTVANYEYLVYWRLYLDGTIECEVRATGIMVVTAFAEGQEHPHGTLVDERTYAPFHQHFLVARLDLDVDGRENTVVRSETRIAPTGPGNPDGLGLVQATEPITTEGYDDLSWETQRTWKVVNERTTNGLGTHPSYKLVPGGAIPPMFAPGSPVLERAGVIAHPVWVTPNDPEQRWPSGEFVVQSTRDHGLPEWVRAGRPTQDTDVVLWYVFGIHHVTRPEDWPVMPSDAVRFELKPFGFFDRNPALDVPPPPGHGGDHCSTHEGHGH
ncbi:primary-amine oxidase [Lapillicoccus jejuensis]|uniref:Amine oxidase n=1 Tax=Lapillicoccus jejuensis TaxID=402171 RepID=A0A542E6B1_9MICO|nr:primary-amine oxidase [Lapillicoccus jejuensis]TQJ10872.1 primary-amine oxidase [Lapillicoccus jejuensis]